MIKPEDHTASPGREDASEEERETGHIVESEDEAGMPAKMEEQIHRLMSRFHAELAEIEREHGKRAEVLVDTQFGERIARQEARGVDTLNVPEGVPKEWKDELNRRENMLNHYRKVIWDLKGRVYRLEAIVDVARVSLKAFGGGDGGAMDEEYEYDSTMTHAEEDEARVKAGYVPVSRVIHTGNLEGGSEKWLRVMKYADRILYEIECLEYIYGHLFEIKIDTTVATRKAEAARRQGADAKSARRNGLILSGFRGKND